MKTYTNYFCYLLILAVATFTSVHVVAQAEIRQSTALGTSTTSNAEVQNRANANLVYQIQLLQQEIQELRGLVEEQAYELKRLKQQRLDDYLDLDKRVSDLTSHLTEKPISTASSATNKPVKQPIPATAVNTEQGKVLYTDAINLLLNKQDYSAAQKKFTAYLEGYPQGQYVPNVYYWQAQILFANGDKKAAELLFKKLIDEHTAHSKVPDAKFKLGRIYFDQGKKDEAKILFDDVAASDTDAALLAKSFINKNY